MINSEADGRTQYDTPDGSHKWRVGQQTVIHGDCLQFLRALPDASVDVVVTSPPYNIGVAYLSYVDRLPHEPYRRHAAPGCTGSNSSGIQSDRAGCADNWHSPGC